MVTCTPTKKAYIYRKHQQGTKFSVIAEELGLNPSVVSRNYHKMEEQGPNPDFYAPPPIPGRPRVITPHAERRAERLITSGHCRDATDVQRVLFPERDPTTVRRMFIRKGLNGRVRRRKPWLSKKHIYSRRKWAEKISQRREFFWRKIWYTDETKYNLFGSDGKKYCRRRVGEELLDRNVTKEVKHGWGNLMAWGCISWNGPGRLHRVEGRMNAKQYVSILEESFLGLIRNPNLHVRNIIFQKDNDPKHTSKLAQAWFKTNKIQLLPWAPSSPDQNIIEPVWDYLDRRIRARLVQPTNLDQLWEALQEEWAKIDIHYIRKLYESIPRRVNALLRAKGSWTKY